MKNTKIQKNNSIRAFTLIEALVAISILMIAIASPMTLAQKGLSTASLSKDQMVAAFLAQDAIESVIGVRDNIGLNGTAGDNWLTFNTIDKYLYPCICVAAQCDFNDIENLISCSIDTTSYPWNSTDAIKSVISATPNINISYKLDHINNTKTFLKYDYSPLKSCETLSENTCTEISKFSRYVNIRKTGFLEDNEAVVSVRVSWDSPLGPQNIDIQNFIYNISENL